MEENKKQEITVGNKNHVEQKSKTIINQSRPSGRERDEGPARVKQNTKDNNNNINPKRKGPDKNEKKGFQISLYII